MRRNRAQLCVGAGEHGHLAGPDEIGIGSQEQLGDLASFDLLVVCDDQVDRGAISAIGDQWTGLVGGAQHVDAGVDDLRCAPVVHREADDLDAREPGLDVDEQRRVGTVEAVDGLRRVADQEQVVAIRAKEIDERVLERVEVLCFVDQKVPEAPADRIGEVMIVAKIADGVAQDVVEVDDATTFLDGLVVGVHGRAPVGARVGAPLLTSCRRCVVRGVDAPCGCPVDLGEVRRQTPPVAGIDRVADQAATVVDHGERTAFVVGPTLFEYAEHHGVERACLDVIAQAETVQALAHLASCFAGERERQRMTGISSPVGDPVCDPAGQHPGLAGSGTGDHRDQVRLGGHRGALVGIQIGDQRVDVHPASPYDPNRRAMSEVAAHRSVPAR